ncbi:MAG: glycosyltransferase [Elusimicrobiota bacterium]
MPTIIDAPSAKHASPALTDHFFSILILTHLRPERLRACLESLARADLRPVKDVIIAVNGEDMRGERIVKSFSGVLPDLKIIRLKRGSRGQGRNAAIPHADADWIYFLDDDVAVHPELFTRAALILKKRPEAWGIGGPNITPKGSSSFEQSSGRVMESWIGAGPMRARYKPGREKWADETSLILCNLCLKKSVFTVLGLAFDPDLKSAEENLLVAKLSRLGARAFYSPELIVYHHRRKSLKSLLFQVYQSGAGRARVIAKFPRAARAIFFLPAFAFIYVGAAALIGPPWPFWIPFCVYALAVAVEAIRWKTESENWAAAARFFSLVFLCHAAYAVGFLTAAAQKNSHERSPKT